MAAPKPITVTVRETTETTETPEVKTVECSAVQIRAIQFYARFKRAEKFVKDKLEVLKGALLGMFPVPTVVDGKTVANSKGRKLASITLQDGKRGFDLEKFSADYPELAEEYTKKGDPFLVIRLH